MTRPPGSWLPVAAILAVLSGCRPAVSGPGPSPEALVSSTPDVPVTTATTTAHQPSPAVTPTVDQSAYPPPEADVPLHHTIAGLPPGAVPMPEAAVRWHQARRAGSPTALPLVVDVVPLVRDGHSDVALVESSPDESNVIWLMSRDGPTERPPDEVEIWRVLDYGDLGLVIEEGAQRRLVLIRWDREREVRVAAYLDHDPASVPESGGSMRLLATRWADDGAGPMLVYDDADEAVLFSEREVGPAVEVARLRRPAALRPVDDDPALEIVEPGNGGWMVRDWDGATFSEPRDLLSDVRDELAVGASDVVPEVDTARLPSLPAHLYCAAEGAIWRWPATGQALERVVQVARPGAAGEAEAVRGPWSVRVARDGSRVLYRVDRAIVRPDGSYRSVAELLLADVPGGEGRVVAQGVLHDDDSFGRTLRTYDFTPDGLSVAYLAFDDETGRSASLRIAPVDAPTEFRELATCGSPDAPRGHCDGFVVAQDGARIAYLDDGGVWVVGLEGEQPRLVAENAEPEEGLNFKSIGPFSPSGAYLLAVGSIIEGGTSYVIAVEPATSAEVPDSFVYVQRWVDLAWSSWPEGLVVADSSGSLGLRDPGELADFKPLLGTTPWRQDASGHRSGMAPFGPHAVPGGGIGYGALNPDPVEFAARGIYSIGRDGTAWRRLAPLPPFPADEDDGLSRGEIVWAPDGSAFLYQQYGGMWREHGVRVVGAADGSGAWRADQVLTGMDGCQWTAAVASP